VLDTVTLARRALRNDEVRNRKLATLAEYFHSPTTPTHRALDDARATVDVLHGLIERLGNLGVSTYEELVNFQGQATEKRRRKRNMADGLPSAPGVYIFYDINDRPLYIGKSIDLRKRVMSYFTAAETRGRMNHMIELAFRVEGITCNTGLEASIRELRLISEHKPRFNVRSRNPENTSWVSFTNERFPRLSIVRNPQLDNDSRITIGPFRSRGYAQLAIDALHDATKIRQCTQRLTTRSTGPACALLDMNKCDAPCLDGSDTTDYNFLILNTQHALQSDPSPIVESLTAKLSTLSLEERFEEAAVVRDRVEAFSSGVARSAHIRALRAIPEIVAASPTAEGGWDIHVIRHGWLAASAHSPHGTSPHPIVDSAIALAATFLGGTTLVSETEMLISWLSQGNTRLVKISEGHSWHTPLKTRPYSADIAKRWLTDMRTVSVESAEPVSID
jgi:DNA polymerase-3 subunit epsilon